MKILSVGNFLGPSWDGSLPDEGHVAQALEAAGHEVIRHQREESMEKPFDPAIAFTLIAQWDRYNSFEIETLPKPLVYWAFDYQADGQQWHDNLILQSDLYLSKQIRDSKYPNWQWLSQDFAPSFLDKYRGDVEQDIDVLFTGSYLPWATDRNETLRAVDDKFNLEIHSFTPDAWKAEGFKNVHGPAMDNELPYLIARARINLSIDLHTTERGYWSDRNAQIMACGGYVLFKYIPFSEVVFGAGIDYFYSVDDCLNKIEKALKDNHYREIVAALGYDAVHRQSRLTVDGRAHDLMIIVEELLCKK